MRRPWIALVALTAACGSAGATAGPASTSPATPPPTVPGVGSLPDTVPNADLATGGDRGAREPLVVITRPVDADGVVAEQIGEQVGGNRLLMIGDSIFAGTENRYGGEMCAGLEPLGWTVEVAAEAGRFVEFGVEVAERLIAEPGADDDAAGDADDPDWDAVGLFLGSNYRGDQEDYDAKMREILDRIAPRPTLLYTVTEYRPNYREVSEVIDQLALEYDNVTVIDWATAAKTPGVLRADGLHPNDEGEQVLVELTAAALGDAPSGDVECLRSQFRDDSAINQGNGTPNTGGSSRGGSTSRGRSSTSGGSSSGGSSSGSSSGGSPTTQPTTDGGSTGSTSDDGGTDGSSTDGSSTVDGGTDGGSTDDGGTDGGSTDGGSTDSGTTDGSSTDGGSTDSGTTDGGSTDGGGTDSSTSGSTGSTSGTATTGTSTTSGGATSGGATSGGATSGGATSGGATSGGATSGGATSGGGTTGGAATSGGSSGGSSTTAGATTGGATGGTADGTAATDG